MMKRYSLYIGLLMLSFIACSQQPPPAIGQPASAKQIDRIVGNLEKPYRLKHIYTVKSELHANAWYVAGVLVGPFTDSSPRGAVWIHIRGPENPGLTASVNGYAKELSPWPDASKTKFNVSMLEDQPSELKRYVEYLGKQ